MSTSVTMMYGWDTMPWSSLERGVFKLQKRIYRASRDNDVKAIHQLQRLLITSKAAILLAVRRVTQDNQGKHTAGIDDLSSLTKDQKLSLVQTILSDPLRVKAQPVRRVWIPKPNQTGKRPLGIPVMEDRARQMLVKMALEPEWEARFEPNSYGFRPGRSCHDAMQAIFNHIRSASKYVLDADIASCFDRINHEALLDKLGTFPQLRRLIRAWLQAAIQDGGKLFPSSEGTPQGGVISPLLANIALHGLATAVEDAFQQFKHQPGACRIPWKPVVIRYADDFVIFHRTLEGIQQAQQVAAEWLKGMGLEMKPEKTRITHTLRELDGTVGFDFLGFHVRQCPRGKNRSAHGVKGAMLGFSPHIRPSPESQKRLLRKIREIVRSHRNVPQERLIMMLNPILRGWGNYFSTVVSKRVFAKMDMCIFHRLWSWASYRHANKGRRWIARKYWLLREHGWTFGIQGKITLHKLADIPIRRHIKVHGHRSPFDGDAFYWSSRLSNHPELPRGMAKYLKAQRGRCSYCGLFFKPGDQLEYLSSFPEGLVPALGRLALVHHHCHPSLTTKKCVDDTRYLTEEPDEGKLSRPVLKTSTSSDTCA